MRRTESRQVSHPNDVSVCAFAWNGAVDRPILSGSSWLYGEVPAGSIIFGGFLQVVDAVTGTLVFRIGTDAVAVMSTAGTVAPGWYPLDTTRFQNPTENILVGLAPAAARLAVTNSGAPVTAGRFAIYLFYVNDELGPFGPLLHPLSVPMMAMPTPQLLMTPPVPTADVPSPFPPAPLPVAPTPTAWFVNRRSRYPRTEPIIPKES